MYNWIIRMDIKGFQSIKIHICWTGWTETLVGFFVCFFSLSSFYKTFKNGAAESNLCSITFVLWVLNCLPFLCFFTACGQRVDLLLHQHSRCVYTLPSRRLTEAGFPGDKRMHSGPSALPERKPTAGEEEEEEEEAGCRWHIWEARNVLHRKCSY